MLTRNASRSRKMVAKAIRNMHAPAYCPVVVGAKAIDQRGVLVEWKKTIAIESIDIIAIMSGDVVDMGIEPSVAVAMDISLVAVPDIDMGIESVILPDMDMSIELVDILATQYTTLVTVRVERIKRRDSEM